MGMGERKKRAKDFKQQTDKAVEDVKQNNIFTTKLTESELTYECIREPEDAPIKIGVAVRLIDMEKRIDVFAGVNSVGYLMPTLVQVLRSKLKLTQRPGRSIGAQVIAVSDVTATFVVRVNKG